MRSRGGFILDEEPVPRYTGGYTKHAEPERTQVVVCVHVRDPDAAQPQQDVRCVIRVVTPATTPAPAH